MARPIKIFTEKEWEENKQHYQSSDYSFSIDGWNGNIYLYKTIK